MTTFDDKGFSVSRYNEIVQDFQDQQLLKVNSSLKFNSNKPLYQLNSIYGYSLDRINKLIEAAFDSLKLSSAEGFHLEEIALTRGVYRISALASSTTTQYCVMEPGSVIPVGSRFSSSASSVQATNTSRVVADTTACNEVVLSFNTILEDEIYSLRINGFPYNITSSTGSLTESQLVNQMIAVLDEDSAKTFTAQNVDDKLVISANEDTYLELSTLTTYLTAESVKVYFSLEVTEAGPISVQAKTIDRLDTSVNGFIETLNDEDFIVGRDEETDAELRVRIQQGSNVSGTGTIPTIRSSLLSSVEGVIVVDVEENTDQSPTNANGIPIGAYETIVVGGEDVDVATEIERSRPVGTLTHGNTSLFVTDDSGVQRFVSFSRPLPINLAAKVEYTLHPEESLPSDALGNISQEVFTYLNNLALGEDFVPQRLIGTVYSASVSGIEGVTIYAQEILTTGEVPEEADWSTARVPISISEYASINLQDIYVVEV